MKLTKNQIRKTQIALNETESALTRAKNYSEDLRDHELIKYLIGHKLKLRKMLYTKEMISE